MHETNPAPMNHPPALPIPVDHPPDTSRQSPKTVRAIGWGLMVVGPGISVTMAIIAFTLFDTIHHYLRPVSPSHWNGGPEFTRLTFELFGSVFFLGIGIFAGGLYQVCTGRRHPVIVGVVLLLAAVTVCFVYGILSIPSPSN